MLFLIPCPIIYKIYFLSLVSATMVLLGLIHHSRPSIYLKTHQKVQLFFKPGFNQLIFFFFLGPHPQHMEVPKLGDESELQLPSYATATATRIQDTSATYTTAHGNAGSLTH